VTDDRRDGIALDRYRRGVPQQYNRLDQSWYGLALRVSFVPPPTVPVSSADIRLEFEPPVSQLGACEPNERFAVYRDMCVKSGKKIKSHLALSGAAEAVLPGIAELVPQLSLDYRSESKAIIVPHYSVIRTASDGERRLAWQLHEDPQNKIDPRQLAARIILGLLPGSAPNMPSPMLTLYAECRCGVLGMRKAVHQKVETELFEPVMECPFYGVTPYRRTRRHPRRSISLPSVPTLTGSFASHGRPDRYT
jgi:hypothetical protein